MATKMTREEAINTVRNIYQTDKEKEALATLIPELAESEDERIRKWLVDYFKEVGKSWIHRDISPEQIVAYLEKQKEKEKYDRTMPVYDNLDSFESALAKAWKAYNDSGSRTVDGCEDDYVECAHAKGFREGYLFGLEEQKEYISNNFDDVWDEEDCEEIIAEGQKLTPRFKELLKEVCHAWYDRGAKLEKQKEQKLAEFTHHETNESLEDAVTHQMEDDGDVDDFVRRGIDDIALKYAELGAKWQKEQKPEWSEEDEVMLKGCIRSIEEARDKRYPNECDANISYNREINWLKSLRPSWKPSKEQMKALLNAEGFLRAGLQHDSAKTIAELYEQLKQL